MYYLSYLHSKPSLCFIILGADVDISSVLIGAAVGASVMMMLCGVFLCVRKASPSRSGPGDPAGLDTKAEVEVEDEESVYANKTVLSESLHYSTVVFPNGDGSEIRGLSKLTADYAIIHHSSEHLTEGGVTEPAIEEVQEENGTNMEQEEATYGNITRPLMMEQTHLDLEEDGNNGIKPSQIQERDSAQLIHSDKAD
ncbi:uncharacterized protein LOC128623536 [Ictalurus furcatus]|uniref:uncharacterized protein LOC128623536 n=1 Tax=Ictalurus furcatus TaxID=66913 RepID=UPI00235085EC|nr:uncharacterized protein LOC128623536 [Ictalurus furcatus]